MRSTLLLQVMALSAVTVSGSEIMNRDAPMAVPFTNGTAMGNGTQWTTIVVQTFTTYCPDATILTHGGKTYTVTKATTLTISDCPTTLTKPVVPGADTKTKKPLEPTTIYSTTCTDDNPTMPTGTTKPCTGAGCPPVIPKPCEGAGCPPVMPKPCEGAGCPPVVPKPCEGAGCPPVVPKPCEGAGCPIIKPCDGPGCPKTTVAPTATNGCEGAACSKFMTSTMVKPTNSMYTGAAVAVGSYRAGVWGAILGGLAFAL